MPLVPEINTFGPGCMLTLVMIGIEVEGAAVMTSWMAVLLALAAHPVRCLAGRDWKARPPMSPTIWSTSLTSV